MAYCRQPVRQVHISTPYGATWIYHYRGGIQGCQVIRSGDWRDMTRDPGSVRAGAIRNTRNAKTQAVRQGPRADRA